MPSEGRREDPQSHPARAGLVGRFLFLLLPLPLSGDLIQTELTELDGYNPFLTAWLLAS
jgi:hypothetical protein